MNELSFFSPDEKNQISHNLKNTAGQPYGALFEYQYLPKEKSQPSEGFFLHFMKES
jgi:hypothetical protein